MKYLVILVFLIGHTLGEVPAPYPASGWRPQGPAFELPPAENNPRLKQTAPPSTRYGYPEIPVGVPQNQYGPPAKQLAPQRLPPAQPQNKYGAPNTQSSSSAPQTQYGAPQRLPQTQPQNQYAAANSQASSSAPQSQYGAPQRLPPQNQYAAPNSQPSSPAPQTQYAAPQRLSPQNQYAAPNSQPLSSAPQTQYGAPQRLPPQNQYAAPNSQPSSSAPQSQYGAPQRLPPTQPQNQYAAPNSQPSSSIPQTQRLPPTQPQNQYGAPYPTEIKLTPQQQQQLLNQLLQLQQFLSSQKRQQVAPQNEYGAPAASGGENPQNQYEPPGSVEPLNGDRFSPNTQYLPSFASPSFRSDSQASGEPQNQDQNEDGYKTIVLTREEEFDYDKKYGPPNPPSERRRRPLSIPETPKPEPDGEENLDDASVDPNISVATAFASGKYYLLLPDGRLQRVTYKTSQSDEEAKSNGFTANLMYQVVEPIKDPIYTVDGTPYVQVNQK